ncbi:MAG TPA: hypothetical protein PKE03_03145 [Bacteroidales bacterium]|nr:hypothetical protein [Bacteroidales bacterium]
MKNNQLLALLGSIMLFLSLSVMVRGQEAAVVIEGDEDNRGWNISAAGGTSVFLGDIKTNPLLPSFKDKNELRYVAVLAGERRFNPWIAGRLHFAYSHVLGTRQEFNVHFQSFVWEAGLTGLFYPINLLAGYNDARFADFYIVAGIGALNYNSTLYQYTTGNVLAKRGYGNGKGIDGTTLAGALVGGLGADFRLSDKLDLRFEIVNKGIQNDLLDVWESGFEYDIYNHMTLGLVYKLGQRGSSRSLGIPEQQNQALGDIWSNVPQKPAEKKEVTDNLQFTPVLEVPAEAEKPAEKPAEEPVAKPVTEPAVQTEPVAKPQTSVAASEFRVQIFAASRPFSKSVLAKRFRLNENEIAEDRFEQFHIYSVGSFSTLEEALAMRDKLRRENGVSDAFVTIWENGKRVGPQFK